MVALILPTAIAWWAENRAKSQFVRASGRRLRVHVPILSFVDARFWPPEVRWVWLGTVLPPCIVAGVVIVWRIADLMVMLRFGACRDCI